MILLIFEYIYIYIYIYIYVQGELGGCVSSPKDATVHWRVASVHGGTHPYTNGHTRWVYKVNC
jgi:hypothetical protein